MLSDDELKLKAQILSFRRQMVRLRSDSHWLSVPSGLREVLAASFGQAEPRVLARIIGFPVETIETWKGQEGSLAKIRRVVEFQKERGKNLTSSPWFRSEVVRLARVAPSVREVARATGVPRASISTWINQGWDQLPEGIPEVGEEYGEIRERAERPEIPESPSDLDSSALALELGNLLARHKGKIRKKYSPSERKLILELADRFGSKEVHEAFKVSYDTIARLKRKREQGGEKKRRTPLRYVPVIDLMRQHPGMGPMQIKDYIYRHLGLSMSVASIRRVMEENGWIPPYAKSTRIKDGLQLYEASRRNYLWHADFKHHYVNKCRCFILFAQDDFSRFITGHGFFDGEKVDDVISVFERAIQVHGKPEVIMTDGGSAFFSWRGVSRFTRFLEDYGIEQVIAQTPNVNGKIENLNQQVEKEKLLVTHFSSLKHFEHELSKWVGFYNFQRPHQGLGRSEVPADRYFPGARTWYGEASDRVKQQSLIAETMATLLEELKKA